MDGLTSLLSVAALPVWIGMAMLVLAALLNEGLGRIPNSLTLGAVLAAWATAALLGGLGTASSTGGGLVSSIACALVALLSMSPAYASGCAPAGCVKSQMALGAWLGCALGTAPAVLVTVVATVAGLLVSAVAVSIYQLRRRAMLESHETSIDLSQPVVLFPLQSTMSLGSLLAIVAIFASGYLG